MFINFNSFRQKISPNSCSIDGLITIFDKPSVVVGVIVVGVIVGGVDVDECCWW